MKGIKLGILGVCLCLAGIAISTYNIIAIGSAAAGLLLALIGCFTKNNE